MDFKSILDQWEHNKKGIFIENSKKSKPSSSDKSPVRSQEEPKMKEQWLEHYPPNKRTLSIKEPKRKTKTYSIWWDRVPAQDSLDLHGFYSRDIEGKITAFIQSLQQRRLRKGLIVHGKGLHSSEGSVLKPLVKAHLKSLDVIWKWGEASRQEGGSGATWFVLKSSHSPED